MKLRNALLASAITLALGLAGLTAVAPRAADAPSVKLESLKWDAFQARLAKAKTEGHKFTLVDAWASNCGPCKENFPHLIAMHEKYAGKGLQVVSLSLDDHSDAKAVESARKFLEEKKAPFLNVLLDEEFGVGYEKLDINAIPAVFVFDSGGKLVKKFTLDDPNKQFTYDEVERAVSGLLGAKAASAK